jgi:N-acetylated-alpha-linked acidic dipeptidase
MKSVLALLLACGLAFPQSPIRGFAGEDLKSEHGREARATMVPSAVMLREYAKRIAGQPHAAGSPASKAVADYVLSLFKDFGLDARIESFEPLLPYPTARVLELVKPVSFAARLKEPALTEDPDSAEPDQLPTYNAFSASGDITAPLVYANYGVPEDYEYLKQQGIDVAGKIVITRYGKSWRGVKPKLAQEHGALGCIIYSDPRDDGYFQGDVYPKGAYRPAQGVQRGSVIDMAVYPGDPLTPGWASEKGARRLSRSEAKSLLKIPVMPISYADAKPMLEQLGGPVVPETWRGALPITYHAGPGAAVVHMKLDFDWTSKPIYNVIATIPGAVYKDEWVMYGNHHDAWVNGASDPTSGAVALLETARTLGTLVKQGWRPKRAIKLALWDGEEFGLMGSTEWVEKHKDTLDRKGVVYLNSDSNGKGILSGSGSHALEQFVTEILRDLPDPSSTKSLLEARNQRSSQDGPFRLGPLGAGSDYVAFIDYIGISSLNFGFAGDGGGGGVYHSIYDSNRWFTSFSDGDFRYGRALAQVMSVALMRLADAAVLPFEFGSLARTVRGYVKEIADAAAKASRKIDFTPLNLELAHLEAAAKNYDEALNASEKQLAAASPEKLARLNETLYRTERALTSGKGLPGREWYHHQLYAPGLYTGYGAKTLPGVREAAEANRWDEASQQVLRVASAIKALNAQVDEATRLLREL